MSDTQNKTAEEKLIIVDSINDSIEETKAFDDYVEYCSCNGRLDQHQSDSKWFCGDCDKEIKTGTTKTIVSEPVIQDNEIKYKKQDLIDLVQGLKNYTHESGNILGHDEREAVEFVDIFLEGKTKRPSLVEAERLADEHLRKSDGSREELIEYTEKLILKNNKE